MTMATLVSHHLYHKGDSKPHLVHRSNADVKPSVPLDVTAETAGTMVRLAADVLNQIGIEIEVHLRDGSQPGVLQRKTKKRMWLGDVRNLGGR